jgi:hypothetical protein
MSLFLDLKYTINLLCSDKPAKVCILVEPVSFNFCYNRTENTGNCDLFSLVEKEGVKKVSLSFQMKN